MGSCIFGCGWWHELGPQVQAAIISAAVTLTVTVFGLVVLYVQLRGAVNTSRITEQMKLKKETYETIADKCRDILATTNVARTALWNVRNEAMLCKSDAQLAVYDTKRDEICKLGEAAIKAAHDIGILVSRWRIIDRRITIFGIAVESILYEAGASLDEISNTDRRDYDQQAYLNAFRGLEESFGVTENYVLDLETAMQNVLLGDLFGKTLPPRVAADANDKVITLGQYDDLKEYFYKETLWGRDLQTNGFPMPG
jgi:hypothetical protein